MELSYNKKHTIAYLSEEIRESIEQELRSTGSEILTLKSAPKSINDWLRNPDLIILDIQGLSNWKYEWDTINNTETLSHVQIILINKTPLDKKVHTKLLQEGIFAIANVYELNQLSFLCTTALVIGEKNKQELLKSNELNRILSTNYLIIDAKNKQLQITKRKLEKLTQEQNVIFKEGIRPIISELDTKLKKEHHYQLFNIHFEEVHPLFYKQLLKTNSKLTDNNLKLLAFLKMGFNNSEISFLLNISLAAVKKSIQRAKPKLKLPLHQSLREYLFEL